MSVNYRGILKNNKFLLRFVTSYSIILLFILVMGSFFYYSAISNSESSLHEQNTALLDTNVNDMNDTLNLFSTLSKQISSNNEIKQLLYYNEKNPKYYILAKSAMNYLTNIMPIEETLPISNYYVYFPNMDYFMSSTTFSDAERFYLYNKQYNRDNYKEWHEMLTSYDNMQQFIPIHSYKKGLNLYVYKLLVCSNLSGSTMPGILYIEVNGDELVNIFSTLSLDADCSLTAVNENMQTMFTLPNGSDLSYNPEEVSSSFFDKDDGSVFYTPKKDYLVTRIMSDYNKWTYYLIQPSSFLLQDFYWIQKIYLGIILFTCMFTLIIIYLLSRENIKPILKITDELESSKAENENLHSTLEQQRPYVYNAYMNRIMKGRILFEGDLAEIASYLNIETLNRSYSVMYVKAKLSNSDIPSKSSTFVNGQTTELRQKLNLLADHSEIIVQTFKKFFGKECYIFKSDIHVYAVLLALPSTISDSEHAISCQEKFQLLHDELYALHQISLFAGLGNKTSHLSYVWESYQQAKEAANYIHESNILQLYQDIIRTNINYYYPLELANQLTNFIQHNNSRQITEIFKMLRRENFEYRSLPLEARINLIADIKNTLVKTRVGIADNLMPSMLLSRIDAITANAISFDDVEKLSLLYCTLFEKSSEENTTFQ